MNGQLTFTMIKPSAFEAGYTGSILSMIEKAGFRIKSLKKVKLTTSQAGDFYECTGENLSMKGWSDSCHQDLSWLLYWKKRMQ